MSSLFVFERRKALTRTSEVTPLDAGVRAAGCSVTAAVVMHSGLGFVGVDEIPSRVVRRHHCRPARRTNGVEHIELLKVQPMSTLLDSPFRIGATESTPGFRPRRDFGPHCRVAGGYFVR